MAGEKDWVCLCTTRWMVVPVLRWGQEGQQVFGRFLCAVPAQVSKVSWVQGMSGLSTEPLAASTVDHPLTFRWGWGGPSKVTGSKGPGLGLRPGLSDEKHLGQKPGASMNPSLRWMRHRERKPQCGAQEPQGREGGDDGADRHRDCEKGPWAAGREPHPFKSGDIRRA